MSSQRIVCPHCRNALIIPISAPATVDCPSCQGRIDWRVELPSRVSSALTTLDSVSDAASSGDLPRAELFHNVTLGDFQVLCKLGTGAMGTVYLAQQLSAQRPVALKVLSRHLSERSTYVKRFYREAEVMARLDHPHIVKLHGAGQQSGYHYFAMEFVDGFTLSGLLARRGGRLKVADALHLVLRCADALGYAHHHGIVHRDVKPSNIMVSQLGHVKLADLGLARPIEEDVSLTDSGLGLGTPHYMAPEQARNAKHADRRSDIYSLGCVLYQLLTGALPFEQDSAMELLLAKQEGIFVAARRRNDAVPPRLDLIIDKILARNPADRYQYCEDLVRDLNSLSLAGQHLSFNPLHVDLPADFDVPVGRINILLVDDNEDAAEAARQALSKCGSPTELTVVRTPEEAMWILSLPGTKSPELKPRLILLGTDVLEKGGLEMILTVKARREFHRVPIIVLTTSETTVQRLSEHGLSPGLQVTTPEELERLGEFLDDSQGSTTLTVVMLPK